MAWRTKLGLSERSSGMVMVDLCVCQYTSDEWSVLLKKIKCGTMEHPDFPRISISPGIRRRYRITEHPVAVVLSLLNSVNLTTAAVTRHPSPVAIPWMGYVGQ